MSNDIHPSFTVMSISQGVIKEIRTVDSVPKHKRRLSKEEFEKLDKKYGRTADPDDLGCFSSKEWKVLKDYKEKFDIGLPIDRASLEQRDYAFEEAKKALAGKRGIVLPEEVLEQKI